MSNGVIPKDRQRVLEDAARTVAYDNPGDEWGVEIFKRVSTFIERTTNSTEPLTREEILFVKHHYNSRQRDIAAP